MAINFEKYFRKDFDIWPEQREVLNWFAEVEDCSEHTKVLTLAAPPATGKTVLAETFAKAVWDIMRWRTAYTTPSNGLLEQVDRDFTDWPMLQGATHYTCFRFPTYKVSEVKTHPHLKEICKGCRKVVDDEGLPRCSYFKARELVLRANHSLFNVMSYLYLPQQDVRASFDVLIVDEFHTLPEFLKTMYDVKFWQADTGFKIGTSASMISMLEFLNYRLSTLRRLLGNKNLDRQTIDKFMQEGSKLARLLGAYEANPTNFVCEEVEEFRYKKKELCLKIRPIYTPKSVIGKFFGSAKRIILMSGTTFPMDIDELGIKKYSYKEVNSPIPVAQRKIIIDCVGSFTYKERDKLVKPMANKIKELVDFHKGQRGVVLLPYSQAELIKEHLPDDFYRFHDKKSKKEIIDDFVSSVHEHQVAVLSGSWEGLDLKGDIAKFVILAQFPLPNWGDSVVKRRTELDQALFKPFYWYDMQAMKNFIQGSGRASRTVQDSSTIYVLDRKFVKSYLKVKGQLPKFFTQALEWRQS